MAGQDRMTIEEVVRQVLRDEHGDVIRESVRAVARELMEAEVSELIGAERGERTEDRATHRNGYRPRRWDTRVGENELQIPKIRQGSYFPSFLQPRKRSEQALVWVVQQAYVCGVSTRRVDQLVESLGLRISKSEVSRIAGLLDEQVTAFRERPLEGRYPYLFVDAKIEKVRDGGRVQRKCVVIAHAVHETGRREIIGLDVGAAETEAFWTEFLRSLVARGLVGVQLAISDAHPGLKAAIARVLGTAWQRCTVHFLRDLRGHARKDQHDLLGAVIRQLFTAADGEEAAGAWPTRSPSCRRDCRRSPRCSQTPKTTSSPSTRSQPNTGPSSDRPTPSSASTARSADAPTSSASSPTTPPSSARCRCSRSKPTTNGSSGAATSASVRWRLSMRVGPIDLSPSDLKRRSPSSPQREPQPQSPTR